MYSDSEPLVLEVLISHLTLRLNARTSMRALFDYYLDWSTAHGFPDIAINGMSNITCNPANSQRLPEILLPSHEEG